MQPQDAEPSSSTRLRGLRRSHGVRASSRGDGYGGGGAGIVWLVEWDDEGLEDEPPPPLLPPEDRLWRHPSEVASGAVTAVRGAVASDQPRMVTVVALTSCISVLLTLGLVAVVRPFREGGARTPTEAAASTPTGGIRSVADVADLTARVRPAIAQVVARDDDGGEAWGSGVIFREDGMVLTTHHLVEDASSFEVLLDDGRAVGARLVGADRDTDIAVIDLEGGGFPVAALAADRSVVQVGQPAITIGTPEGRTTAGPLVRTTVVSAMGQEAGVDGRRFVDMIRTDTPMEPGCDGGAVVDHNGQVIAIAATNVRSGDGMIGLATPIDVAHEVAAQLMSEGRVRRGWLGIEGSTGRNGVVVRKVLPGSPAAEAGLATGDVIRAVGTTGITSMTDLVVRLRTLAPGAETTVVVERQGEQRTVEVTLAERPS